MVKETNLTLDQKIIHLAQTEMCYLVQRAEGEPPRIRYPSQHENASAYFVSRMFTDAIFHQDIRTIQRIIERIDGIAPTDEQMDDYQTLFGDCLNEVLNLPQKYQTKILPHDSAMMCLCKSLYDIATTDIYWDEWNEKMKKPSVEQKSARDTAIKIILERSGGRKTKTAIEAESQEYDLAEWIKKSLPESVENVESCESDEDVI